MTVKGPTGKAGVALQGLEAWKRLLHLAYDTLVRTLVDGQGLGEVPRVSAMAAANSSTAEFRRP